MPVYSVVLEGRSIFIPSISGNENRKITGFYAARKIVAPSEELAVQSAKGLIFEQWEEDGFKSANGGRDPVLELDSICKMNFFQRLYYKVPSRGYTFY